MKKWFLCVLLPVLFSCEDETEKGMKYIKGNPYLASNGAPYFKIDQQEKPEKLYYNGEDYEFYYSDNQLIGGKTQWFGFSIRREGDIWYLTEDYGSYQIEHFLQFKEGNLSEYNSPHAKRTIIYESGFPVQAEYLYGEYQDSGKNYSLAFTSDKFYINKEVRVVLYVLNEENVYFLSDYYPLLQSGNVFNIIDENNITSSPFSLKEFQYVFTNELKEITMKDELQGICRHFEVMYETL